MIAVSLESFVVITVAPTRQELEGRRIEYKQYFAQPVERQSKTRSSTFPPYTSQNSHDVDLTDPFSSVVPTKCFLITTLEKNSRSLWQSRTFEVFVRYLQSKSHHV